MAIKKLKKNLKKFLKLTKCCRMTKNVPSTINLVMQRSLKAVLADSRIWAVLADSKIRSIFSVKSLAVEAEVLSTISSVEALVKLTHQNVAQIYEQK